MSSESSLIPADPADVADSLAFHLRYNGRKPIHSGDQFMAELMARHLVEKLQQSGFVLMRRSPSVTDKIGAAACKPG